MMGYVAIEILAFGIRCVLHFSHATHGINELLVLGRKCVLPCCMLKIVADSVMKTQNTPVKIKIKQQGKAIKFLKKAVGV